jgi:tetratricopeptide (TPR) repeat protein
MAAKMDKNELNEPDKLQLFFISLRTFIEKHRNRIYAATGGFLLIFILACGWYLYQQNYESSADKQFFSVVDAKVKAGSTAGDGVAIAGYKEVITQYPRSQAAISARYKLANLYVGRKQFDLAITSYEEFLAKADSENDLVSLAFSGLGYCFESNKEFDKALIQYEKALKAGGAASFEALYLGSIARVHEEMKNFPKAAEYYKKALDKTSDPMMGLYLKRKLALLG